MLEFSAYNSTPTAVRVKKKIQKLAECTQIFTIAGQDRSLWSEAEGLFTIKSNDCNEQHASHAEPDSNADAERWGQQRLHGLLLQ